MSWLAAVLDLMREILRPFIDLPLLIETSHDQLGLLKVPMKRQMSGQNREVVGSQASDPSQHAGEQASEDGQQLEMEEVVAMH